MYRIFQFFVLAIKVDIFMEFLISLFYLIQFALANEISNWNTWFQLVITVLLLPMLYFARTAVSYTWNFLRTLKLMTFLLYREAQRVKVE